MRKSEDAEYVQSNRWVFETSIRAIAENPSRTFTVTNLAHFVRWWEEATDDLKDAVRNAAADGRLAFDAVGWATPASGAVWHADRTASESSAALFLLHAIGPAAAPRAMWELSPFGHTLGTAAAAARAGVDILALGGVSPPVAAALAANGSAEFLWSAAPFGAHADPEGGAVLTHVLLGGWNTPPFAAALGGPFGEAPTLNWNDHLATAPSNVADAAAAFVSGAVAAAAAAGLRHGNLLVPVGGDGAMTNAAELYTACDHLLAAVNASAAARGGGVVARYSTLAAYAAAVRAAVPPSAFPRRDGAAGDFATASPPPGVSPSPIGASPAHRPAGGAHANRQDLKGAARSAGAALRASEALAVLGAARGGWAPPPSLAGAPGGLAAWRRVVAEAQAVAAAGGFVTVAVAKVVMAELAAAAAAAAPEVRARFVQLAADNVTRTALPPGVAWAESLAAGVAAAVANGTGGSVVALVFNPTAQPRRGVVRVAVPAGATVVVQDSCDAPVPFQIVPPPSGGVPPEASATVLYFYVDVGALGHATYVIRTRPGLPSAAAARRPAGRRVVAAGAAPPPVFGTRVAVGFGGQGLPAWVCDLNTGANVTMGIAPYAWVGADSHSGDHFAAATAAILRPAQDGSVLLPNTTAGAPAVTAVYYPAAPPPAGLTAVVAAVDLTSAPAAGGVVAASLQAGHVSTTAFSIAAAAAAAPAGRVRAGGVGVAAGVLTCGGMVAPQAGVVACGSVPIMDDSSAAPVVFPPGWFSSPPRVVLSAVCRSPAGSACAAGALAEEVGVGGFTAVVGAPIGGADGASVVALHWIAFAAGAGPQVLWQGFDASLQLSAPSGGWGSGRVLLLPLRSPLPPPPPPGAASAERYTPVYVFGLAGATDVGASGACVPVVTLRPGDGGAPPMVAVAMPGGAGDNACATADRAGLTLSLIAFPPAPAARAWPPGGAPVVSVATGGVLTEVAAVWPSGVVARTRVWADLTGADSLAYAELELAVAAAAVPPGTEAGLRVSTDLGVEAGAAPRVWTDADGAAMVPRDADVGAPEPLASNVWPAGAAVELRGAGADTRVGVVLPDRGVAAVAWRAGGVDLAISRACFDVDPDPALSLEPLVAAPFAATRFWLAAAATPAASSVQRRGLMTLQANPILELAASSPNPGAWEGSFVAMSSGIAPGSTVPASAHLHTLASHADPARPDAVVVRWEHLYADGDDSHAAADVQLAPATIFAKSIPGAAVVEETRGLADEALGPHAAGWGPNGTLTLRARDLRTFVVNGTVPGGG